MTWIEVIQLLSLWYLIVWKWKPKFKIIFISCVWKVRLFFSFLFFSYTFKCLGNLSRKQWYLVYIKNVINSVIFIFFCFYVFYFFLLSLYEVVAKKLPCVIEVSDFKFQKLYCVRPCFFFFIKTPRKVMNLLIFYLTSYGLNGITAVLL